MKSSGKDKILIVRFSSIGDIVLTTPIVRSLRACRPDSEIHFLTKTSYVPLIQNNPHLDRVIGFEGDFEQLVRSLRAEGYSFILDLHGSLRSRLLRLRLRLPSAVYPKDRWPVLLYTRFRLGRLPSRHTVERYGVALGALGCSLDGGRAEVFLPPDMLDSARQTLLKEFKAKPVAIALGGLTATKRWPREYFAELIRMMGLPILLLGGKAEEQDAQWIASQVDVPVWVAAGKYGLLESTALMTHAMFVISHDSGFMHIASSFDLPLVALWGSTVPELGFAPYKAPDCLILERKDLACRPCSKLGSDSCPQKHFDCMMGLTPSYVFKEISRKFDLKSEGFS